MKLILMSILIFASLKNSFCGEVTGAGYHIERVLRRNNMSEGTLQAQGFRLGEVTGSGRRVNISDITYVLTTHEMIPMNRVSHLSYHNGRSGRIISDLSGLEYRGQLIPSSRFLGIIYR